VFRASNQKYEAAMSRYTFRGISDRDNVIHWLVLYFS
jgi:hypothetical protein